MRKSISRNARHFSYDTRDHSRHNTTHRRTKNAGITAMIISTAIWISPRRETNMAVSACCIPNDTTMIHGRPPLLFDTMRHNDSCTQMCTHETRTSRKRTRRMNGGRWSRSARNFCRAIGYFAIATKHDRSSDVYSRHSALVSRNRSTTTRIARDGETRTHTENANSHEKRDAETRKARTSACRAAAIQMRLARRPRTRAQDACA